MYQLKNGIKQYLYGFLDKNVEENLEVYKNNFDIVLTNEDASFETAKTLLL
ncbi:MAG: hypothetical protein IKF38_07080 [Clostridia bacterium]|nr:hypothetical protein [Clostridia bacterium]